MSKSLLIRTKDVFINELLDRFLIGREILSREISSDEKLMPIIRDADIYEEVNRIFVANSFSSPDNEYLRYYESILPAVDADLIPGYRASFEYQIKLSKAKVNNSISRIIELLKVIESMQEEVV